jgi:hypothetical protein
MLDSAALAHRAGRFTYSNKQAQFRPRTDIVNNA